MRKNFSFLAVLASVLAVAVMTGFTGCAPASQQAAPTVTDYVAKTITVGNHSWVPIYRLAEPGEYDITAEGARLVLETIDAFERSHPELEVVDWKQEIRHNGYSSRFRIYGVWVDHKLKPGYVETYQAGGYPTGQYEKVSQ